MGEMSRAAKALSDSAKQSCPAAKACRMPRHAATTTLRGLTPEQVKRVGPFLTDDGTLGEFVFGGGVDD